MTSNNSAQVVIVGGGATGIGILRDLAMRGVRAVLVEQNDLAHGTSSRFHGLLHSGARYAVNDREAAEECARENAVIKRIAPGCIEDIGGLFVQLPEDDPGYADRWVDSCRASGIAVEEVPVKKLLPVSPALSPRIVRAFAVPDAAVDGFRLIWANVRSARRHGARIVTYHRVTGIISSNGGIEGVELTSTLTGEKSRLECRVLVNAAGPWAGGVAEMAGLKVEVLQDKGTLLVFNHRFLDRVVNRLRPPSSGDIFVPHNTVTILGTTSGRADSPDRVPPERKEVNELLDTGRQVIPGLMGYRVIRAFAGVRPLYRSEAGREGRSISRNFVLLDHEKEGLEGMVSILGGKLTTYRLMAEKAADLVCGKLGVDRACPTGREPLSEPVPEEMLERGKAVLGDTGSLNAAGRWGEEFGDVLRRALADPIKALPVCECEMVSRAEIEHAAGREDTFNLDDIRRKTRMGMGTCQGTFCACVSLGVVAEYSAGVLEDNLKLLGNYLQGRWEGIRPVLWGQQLRESQLALGIYSSLFNLIGDIPPTTPDLCF